MGVTPEALASSFEQLELECGISCHRLHTLSKEHVGAVLDFVERVSEFAAAQSSLAKLAGSESLAKVRIFIANAATSPFHIRLQHAAKSVYERLLTCSIYHHGVIAEAFQCADLDQPFEYLLARLPRTASTTKVIWNMHSASLYEDPDVPARNAAVLLTWAGLEGVQFPCEAISDASLEQYLDKVIELTHEETEACHELAFVVLLIMDRLQSSDHLPAYVKLLQSLVQVAYDATMTLTAASMLSIRTADSVNGGVLSKSRSPPSKSPASPAQRKGRSPTKSDSPKSGRPASLSPVVTASKARANPSKQHQHTHHHRKKRNTSVRGTSSSPVVEAQSEQRESLQQEKRERVRRVPSESYAASTSALQRIQGGLAGPAGTIPVGDAAFELAAALHVRYGWRAYHIVRQIGCQRTMAFYRGVQHGIWTIPRLTSSTSTPATESDFPKVWLPCDPREEDVVAHSSGLQTLTDYERQQCKRLADVEPTREHDVLMDEIALCVTKARTLSKRYQNVCYMLKKPQSLAGQKKPPPIPKDYKDVLRQLEDATKEFISAQDVLECTRSETLELQRRFDQTFMPKRHMDQSASYSVAKWFKMPPYAMENTLNEEIRATRDLVAIATTLRTQYHLAWRKFNENYHAYKHDKQYSEPLERLCDRLTEMEKRHKPVSHLKPSDFFAALASKLSDKKDGRSTSVSLGTTTFQSSADDEDTPTADLATQFHQLQQEILAHGYKLPSRTTLESSQIRQRSATLPNRGALPNENTKTVSKKDVYEQYRKSIKLIKELVETYK
eukprot:m.178303 g.178303  ORF g.178303 m.178303 type:complete len:785 (-) comp16589_c0_seq2:1189-3543(-)